ncbi:Uncharacterised protein [Mycobacterium tuberculosis]|nr:Uncharacterised protein [Mycobacterium tuberculosis]
MTTSAAAWVSVRNPVLGADIDTATVASARP